MTLGKRIAARRQSLGLTREALADAVSIAKSSISEWESGKREPRLPTLEKIAAVLDTTIEALMHDGPAEAEAYGDRIKRMRRARGMSAEDLAEATGISPATIYRYENGSTEDLKLSTIERLAEALRTTPAHLAGWTEAGNHQDTTRPTDTTHHERSESHMITLNDLLTIVDAHQLRVIVPVTPRLKACITVNTRNAAELDDLIRLYGESPVFSAEPANEMRVMEIELTRRDDLALTDTKGMIA